MNSAEQKPNLPTWLFVVTDLALIGAAAAIAFRSDQPLSNAAVLAIVACVGLGAIVGLVPIVVRFERLKNEALDDRQRALEGLARTLTSAAEQISIATGSLHEIAELSQKNLRHAEHLPHKLQEKIAEFQAQLAGANDADKEEMEKEIVELRASESERLEATASRIAKSAADWAKLEAATAQHLAAATEALARLPAGAVAAITAAQAAAEKSLADARTAAARSLADAEGHATRTVGAAQTAALAALEAKLAEFEVRIAKSTTQSAALSAAALQDPLARAAAELEEKLARFSALARSLETTAAGLATASAASAAVVVATHAAPPPASDPAPSPVSDAGTAAPAATEPVASGVASPPAHKRHRRTRRDEPAADPAAAPAPEPPAAAVEEPPPAVPAAETAVAVETPPPNPVAAEAVPIETVPEPPPIPVATILEIAPATPDTLEPFAISPAPVDAPPPPVEAAEAPPSPPSAAESTPEAVAAESAKPPTGSRRRASRKAEPEPTPVFDLPLEDSSPASAPGQVERTLSSDGATRLIATAYIGIGNRLFIRGEGPGLSWEKGVPLQFVSIGKWRWETNDASAPVRFKLYKNDDLECTALGEQTLEPGHLQEMLATF